MTTLTAPAASSSSSSSHLASLSTSLPPSIERVTSLENWRSNIWRNESQQTLIREAREAAMDTAKDLLRDSHRNVNVNFVGAGTTSVANFSSTSAAANDAARRVDIADTFPIRRTTHNETDTSSRNNVMTNTTNNSSTTTNTRNTSSTTTTNTSNKIPKPSRKRTLKWKQGRRSNISSNQLIRRTHRVTQDCFQCTVCATIFTSFDVAYHHEIHCLSHLNQQHHQATTSSNNNISSTEVQQHARRFASPPPPPIHAAAAAPNTTTTTTGSSNTKAIKQVNPAMKECILLTEESLIAAVNLSKHAASGVLTMTQVDAERELTLLWRDRLYYQSYLKANKEFYHQTQEGSLQFQKDHKKDGGGRVNNISASTSSEQHQSLKRPRSSRGRAGIKLWNKLSDKLSHAYFLIKEGEDFATTPPMTTTSTNTSSTTTGGTLSNHIESRRSLSSSRRSSTSTRTLRNWRSTVSQPSLKGLGISQNSETLYLNIIVKPSVQFVNNELERLAREFWVKKNVPNTTTTTSTAGATTAPSIVQVSSTATSTKSLSSQAFQQLVPPLPSQQTPPQPVVVVERNHFQKLKAMAQGHAVKLAKLALNPNPHLIAVQFSNDLHR